MLVLHVVCCRSVIVSAVVLLVTFQSKQNSSSDRVPLVVTYNPALPNLHKILKEHQPILDTSPKTQAIFKEPPLVAFRRGRSLSQMLTHKRLPSSNTSNITSSSDHPTQQTSDWLPNPSDTTCTICGRSFQTNRNLKIHFTHKHKQQSPSTHSDPGFWPCRTDIRCACCKTYGQFTRRNRTWIAAKIFNRFSQAMKGTCH